MTDRRLADIPEELTNQHTPCTISNLKNGTDSTPLKNPTSNRKRHKKRAKGLGEIKAHFATQGVSLEGETIVRSSTYEARSEPTTIAASKEDISEKQEILASENNKGTTLVEMYKEQVGQNMEHIEDDAQEPGIGKYMLKNNDANQGTGKFTAVNPEHLSQSAKRNRRVSPSARKLTSGNNAEESTTKISDISPHSPSKRHHRHKSAKQKLAAQKVTRQDNISAGMPKHVETLIITNDREIYTPNTDSASKYTTPIRPPKNPPKETYSKPSNVFTVTPPNPTASSSNSASSTPIFPPPVDLSPVFTPLRYESPVKKTPTPPSFRSAVHPEGTTARCVSGAAVNGSPVKRIAPKARNSAKDP